MSDWSLNMHLGGNNTLSRIILFARKPLITRHGVIENLLVFVSCESGPLIRNKGYM